MGSALEPADTFVIPEATEEELQIAIDHAAHFYLGLSSEEFFRRWHAHDLCEDDPQVQNLLYVLNFIRSAKGEPPL